MIVFVQSEAFARTAMSSQHLQILVEFHKYRIRCSQGCRDADNSVHKVCCKQGDQVEERKVKTGGKEKTEVALSTVKSYASTCLQELRDRTHLHAKPDYEESVAHFSDLVEKIQLKKDRKLLNVQRLSEVD